MGFEFEKKGRRVLGIALIFVVLSLVACSNQQLPVDTPVPTSTAVPVVDTQQEIPEPASWSFPDVVESAREISPHNVEGKPFNEFGLVYPQSEVETLSLATLSAEELQKYADIVTYAYPDAVFQQILVSCEEIPLDQINETTIANIAYVSLQAIDSGTREEAAICLSEIQERIAEKGSLH